VEVSVERGIAGCRVQVSDNGRGIPAEHHEAIFEWRTRGGHAGPEGEIPPPENRQKDREDGSGGDGIGLALAREAVRQLGGELTVESMPGEGSTFSFTLPPVRADLAGS
jgi:two-component system, NarL family, sensor histidine kinase BarA